MNATRNYEKFFTYPETARFMANLLDPKPCELILEPSAGSGALIRAVKNICPDCFVYAVEINQKWENELRMLADNYSIDDFLLTILDDTYDKCIANPPFGNETNLQDHFDNIISHVKTGGKIIMLVPAEFEPDVKRKEYPLENWSKNSDGTTTEIKIIEFENPY